MQSGLYTAQKAQIDLLWIYLLAKESLEVERSTPVCHCLCRELHRGNHPNHSLSRCLHLGTCCGAFVLSSLVRYNLVAHVGESPFAGLDLGDRRS